MAVEILSVSLSDESVEKLAGRLAQILAQHVITPVNNAVTQSNPPSPETQSPQNGQVSQQQGDPWQNPGVPQTVAAPPVQAPVQQYQPPAPVPAQAAPPPPGPIPVCAHGQKKWVPPGISKSTNKPYNGFYACPAPRGQQCPR